MGARRGGLSHYAKATRDREKTSARNSTLPTASGFPRPRRGIGNLEKVPLPRGQNQNTRGTLPQVLPPLEGVRRSRRGVTKKRNNNDGIKKYYQWDS